MRAWRRHQRCEFGDELDGLKLDVRRAVLPRRLELVANPALRRDRQALVADRRARDVAAQAFELLALVRLRGDAGVQREAADLAGCAFQRAGVVGQHLQCRHLAPGVLASRDAVGDGTHAQCVHGVVAASTFREEGRFVLAFEPAFARQMPAHAIRDPVSQVRQLRGGRGASAMQAWFALRLLHFLLVHAVKPQHVEVHVKVKRAAEALDQRHRAALRAVALNARLIRQPARDHAMHDPQHRADHFRLAGEQEAQGVWKAQHPLPHRARAEHLLRQAPRTLGHAPRAAARAEAAFLAGKRQQPLGMALLAHHAQEAVFEHAAAQVFVELLAHVLGQRAIFRRKTCNEVRVVRLHQRVQQRTLGNMARVGRRGRQRGRCGASGARRCASLRCGEAQHGTLLCIDGCTVFRAASSPHIGVSPAHGEDIGAAQRRKSPTCCCCPRPRPPVASPGCRRRCASP